MPTWDLGSGWQLPPLKVFDFFFLIVINILPFPQSICKKRAGFTFSLVFCLSHPWAGKRQPWGAGPGGGGKARADLQQGTEFLVLVTYYESLEPQLGDSVTSVTWLPL